MVVVEIFPLTFIFEKTWNNFKCEWSIFTSVGKWSFTFVSAVSKLLKKSYSFLNFRLYLVISEASAIINIFFTVIKLFFYEVSDANCYFGRFSNFFYSDRPWHRLTDSIKTLFTAFCKFSFDSLLDGLTKQEM